MAVSTRLQSAAASRRVITALWSSASERNRWSMASMQTKSTSVTTSAVESVSVTSEMNDARKGDAAS